MFDVAIIGGGPAGSAAGVYAARKLLKTVLIAESFGGQSVVSAEVQNWIGTEKISGEDLGKRLEAHVRAYAGEAVSIALHERVVRIAEMPGGFSVAAKSGKTFEAKTVLIATGGERKKLDAKGAAEFDQKGLTYCASCDGPLFAGMDVAVVGGGNAGFETAAQLLAYAKSVTLLQRGDAYKADPATVKKVLTHPKMRGILNARPTEVFGDGFVTGMKYADASGKEETLSVSGIFIEIGLKASTDFAEGLVELDAVRRIVVDPTNQRASRAGVWAAGDCTNGLYHQNNIAAGDAVKAIEDMFLHLSA